MISASGVRAGATADSLKINKSRANTNRFITSCRELRRGNSDWFALWRDDRGIDDETWVEGVKRGNFRLHPGTVSEGCITIAHNSDPECAYEYIVSTGSLHPFPDGSRLGGGCCQWL